jgi:hypothetical protein
MRNISKIESCRGRNHHASTNTNTNKRTTLLSGVPCRPQCVKRFKNSHFRTRARYRRHLPRRFGDARRSAVTEARRAVRYLAGRQQIYPRRWIYTGISGDTRRSELAQLRLRPGARCGQYPRGYNCRAMGVDRRRKRSHRPNRVVAFLLNTRELPRRKIPGCS